METQAGNLRARTPWHIHPAPALALTGASNDYSPGTPGKHQHSIATVPASETFGSDNSARSTTNPRDDGRLFIAANHQRQPSAPSTLSDLPIRPIKTILLRLIAYYLGRFIKPRLTRVKFIA